MKKFLLSLATVALSAVAATAAQYEVFPVTGLTWTGDAGGFTTTTTVDGKSFAFTTEKDASTSDLVVPSSDMIRVYKNSKITVSSTDFEFTTIVFKASASNYGKSQTLSSGWEQTWDATALTLTCTSKTPQKSIVMTASGNQFRVTGITVADADITPTEPEDPTPTTTVEVASVKATIAQAAMTPVKVNYALTVGYGHSGNIFACDEAGDFIQVYKKDYQSAFKPGDVIPAGWEGTYDVYNGTPEIVFTELPAATAGTFTPKAVDAADITAELVNSVIEVKNVVFAAATPDTKANFEGTSDGETLTFRNNYTLGAVAAGTYNVTVVVSVYNSKVQLYPIEYKTLSGETPDPVEPDPVEPSLGDEEMPYTVDQILALETAPSAAVWVKGFITGDVNGSKISAETLETKAPFNSNTNILLSLTKTLETEEVEKEVTSGEETTTVTETFIKNALVVQLPSGNLRKDLNLQENPQNLGAEVKVLAKVEKYFGVQGLKNTTKYAFLSEVVEPDPVTVKTEGEGTEEKPYTVADVNAISAETRVTNATTDVWVLGYMTGYVTSSNKPVFSAEEAQSTNLVLTDVKEATVESEWVAVQLPSGEIRNALNLNENPNMIGSKIAVKGNLEIYLGHAGLTGVSDNKIIENSGVANVAVDAEAPVEYFNLQGVRVANPENGIFIRRQGSTVTKIAL